MRSVDGEPANDPLYPVFASARPKFAILRHLRHRCGAVAASGPAGALEHRRVRAVAEAVRVPGVDERDRRSGRGERATEQDRGELTQQCADDRLLLRRETALVERGQREVRAGVRDCDPEVDDDGALIDRHDRVARRARRRDLCDARRRLIARRERATCRDIPIRGRPIRGRPIRGRSSRRGGAHKTGAGTRRTHRRDRYVQASVADRNSDVENGRGLATALTVPDVRTLDDACLRVCRRSRARCRSGRPPSQTRPSTVVSTPRRPRCCRRSSAPRRR